MSEKVSKNDEQEQESSRISSNFSNKDVAISKEVRFLEPQTHSIEVE